HEPDSTTRTWRLGRGSSGIPGIRRPCGQARPASRRRRRAGALVGLRRGFLAGNVQQVLDATDSLNLARLGLQILDQVRLLELAAKIDDAVLDVDVDLPLWDVGAAEDLALDLARQRHVVGLRFLLLGEVRRLLLQPLSLDRGALRLLPGLAEVLAVLVHGDLAAPATVVGIEEVRECGSNGSCQSE